MAKPDDRSDNVEKLREHVQNTVQNIDESEEYLAMRGDDIDNQERQAIIQNNQNRRESLEGMRDEIRDEVQHQRSQS